MFGRHRKYEMLETCKKWYHYDKPLKIEWGFIVVISTIMLISFFYSDTRSLTVWSVNLLDSIADGKLRDFYLYCYINEYGAASPTFAGPYFAIIPWAIWNIPIWLIQKYAGIAIISNSWLILWSKLFLVLVELLVLWLAYKITLLLTGDKNKSLWVMFLSASFPFMLVGVYYSGQTDIIVIAYGLIAVYELLQRHDKLFLVFSAFAIIAKPFFIFPFILLVLFTEKNILKIFLKLFSGFSLMLLFQLIYSNAPMYQESYDLTLAGQNMDMLTRTSFGNVLMTEGSWFFLFFVFMCVIAYIKKPEENGLRNKFIIYFVNAANLLILGFTTIQHYRPIYLVPFLFIMFMLNNKWYRINVIIETFYSATTLLALFCGSKAIFTKNSMENTLITKVFPLAEKTYDNIRELFLNRIENYETYHKIFASVSVACIVLMLIINYPLLRKESEIDCTKCERWIIWINMFVMALVLLCVFKIFMGWFSFI